MKGKLDLIFQGPSQKPPRSSTNKPGSKTDVATLVKPKTQTPRLYQVILHNDDYTPMDLVTEVLVRFFDKPFLEATHIMLTVHKKGRGVAGVFTREVAETKVDLVTEYARSHDAPLLCTLEEA